MHNNTVIECKVDEKTTVEIIRAGIIIKKFTYLFRSVKGYHEIPYEEDKVFDTKQELLNSL